MPSSIEGVTNCKMLAVSTADIFMGHTHSIALPLDKRIQLVISFL